MSDIVTTALPLERSTSDSLSFRKVQVAVWLAVLTLLTGVVAYFESFSHMALYDDEGFLMISLRRFFEGQVLYDQSASAYGPLYYLYQWAAHHVMGTALSHDSVRFVSVAFLLATTAVCFLAVYRLTRSVLIAGIALVLVSRELSLLSQGPAHPQEACAFLLPLVGLQACAARGRAYISVSLGVLAGAIVLTKINLGACVLLALSVIFFAMLREGSWQRAGLWSASSAAALFPVFLMRPNIGERWAATFCFVEVLSICAVALAVSRTTVCQRFRWRDILLALLAFLATLGTISSFVFSRGTTPAAMIRWLVIWPATVFQHWSIPLLISPLTIPLAMVSLLTAWQFGVKKRNHTVVALLKIGFAVGVMLLCRDHYSFFGFLVPWLWLVAVPTHEPFTDAQALGRAALAVVGVLQALYAYPIAASHVEVPIVFMILAAAVCLWDVRGFVRLVLPVRWQSSRIDRFAGAAAMLLLGAYCGLAAWRAYRSYEALSPLELPGSNRIHLSARRASGLQKLVTEARSSCTSLLTAPGMYSFNLWTGLPLPDLMLISDTWMIFLTDQQQSEVAREFSREPHGCVIDNPEVVKWYTRGSEVYSKPLMRFINEKFHVVTTAYGYQLMLRN